MRAKNLAVLSAEIKARYPGVVVYGIGDAAHRLRTSDHNEDDTAGVRAAQSDADSVPEHRAIDVMLGSAFSRAQADVLILELLAVPRLRDRLFYIIFHGRIWSRSYGWVTRPHTIDPHDDHIHISGWAANDDDVSSWLNGVGVMKVTDVQQALKDAGLLVGTEVDGVWGPNSQSSLTNAFKLAAAKTTVLPDELKLVLPSETVTARVVKE